MVNMRLDFQESWELRRREQDSEADQQRRHDLPQLHCMYVLLDQSFSIVSLLQLAALCILLVSKLPEYLKILVLSGPSTLRPL